MWRDFEKVKPVKKGWYLCTTKVKGYPLSVIKLFWYPREKKFIDNAVRKILTRYVVINKGKRITDLGQDRTPYVVAWKNIPKPYEK